MLFEPSPFVSSFVLQQTNNENIGDNEGFGPNGGGNHPLACLDESGYREKRIQHSADVEELIRALDGLSLERDYWIQTACRVKSLDAVERFEGTKQFRMMLSVSGEIPIQDVIDTGVVPMFVRFLDSKDDSALQFEAAWALTNIASGTGTQTQVRKAVA